MDLDAFFREEGIFEYAIVRFEDLPDADRSAPCTSFPPHVLLLSSVTQIPAPDYEAPPKEKTQKMLRIAESLDLTAVRLAGLLISPRHGTRLVLSGVVTEMGAGPSKTPLAVDFCGNCVRCVRSCPGGAISADGVNVFRCRNISPGSRSRLSRQRSGCWVTSPSSALQQPSLPGLPVMQPCDAAFV